MVLLVTRRKLYQIQPICLPDPNLQTDFSPDDSKSPYKVSLYYFSPSRIQMFHFVPKTGKGHWLGPNKLWGKTEQRTTGSKPCLQAYNKGV